MSSASEQQLRVLRVSHSGVVAAWRERDRQLNDLGCDMTLVTAARWNEGGRVVQLEPGDSFVIVARTFGRHPYRFLYDPVALWRAMRRQQFDVIDVHEEPASLAAAEVQLVARIAGRRGPFCLYSAQNIEKRYPVPFRWLERIALRRAAAVHTCNAEAGRVLERKGYRGKICNLGLGVDIERFAPAAKASRASGLRVGFVGRLETRKGVAVLVAAVAQLAGCSLQIVGDGEQRSTVEQQIASLGIRDRVTISGFAAHDELPSIYRTFDVAVVPSLDTPGWVEQFGRVAVEAMASGLPVVVSKSGSLPDVVGDAGVLVPPGDVAALATALRRLADDPTERARLGALARDRVKRYSWRSVASKQLELYREVLGDGARG